MAVAARRPLAMLPKGTSNVRNSSVAESKVSRNSMRPTSITITGPLSSLNFGERPLFVQPAPSTSRRHCRSVRWSARELRSDGPPSTYRSAVAVNSVLTFTRSSPWLRSRSLPRTTPRRRSTQVPLDPAPAIVELLAGEVDVLLDDRRTRPLASVGQCQPRPRSVTRTGPGSYRNLCIAPPSDCLAVADANALDNPLGRKASAERRRSERARLGRAVAEREHDRRRPDEDRVDAPNGTLSEPLRAWSIAASTRRSRGRRASSSRRGTSCVIPVRRYAEGGPGRIGRYPRPMRAVPARSLSLGEAQAELRAGADTELAIRP